MKQLAHEVYRHAVVRLTMRHPLFAQLYYSIPNYVEDIPTAMTNGTRRIFGKEFMDACSVDTQAFVKAHEVMHDALMHSWRRGSRNPKLWNYACDLKVNQLLTQSDMEMPTYTAALLKYFKDNLPDPPPAIGDVLGLRDPKYDAMSEEQIYNSLVDEGGGGGDGIPDPMGDDVQDAEGSDTEKAEAMESMKAAVLSAVKAAKEFGKCPAWADEMVDTLCNRKEKWYEHLRRYFTSRSKDKYDPSRLNRRELQRSNIVTPVMYNECVDHVVIGIDESGSIDNILLGEFAAHVNDIMFDCKPRKVTVLYFDTKVSKDRDEYTYADLPITLRRVAGGGTSFKDVCAEAEVLQADVFICLTDLYGSLPDTCAVPVVWACVSDQIGPFGETVHVERD